MHIPNSNCALGERSCGVGTAHGKSILIGEHAVVYGAPAIAFPLHNLAAKACVSESITGNLQSAVYSGELRAAPEQLRPILAALRAAAKRFRVDYNRLSLKIESPIPVERGLGSSAAVATAIVRAVADYAHVQLSDLERFNLVQHAERIAHGTSSGLDAHAVAAQAPLLFSGGSPIPLRTNTDVTLVIADTGTPGKTSIAVGGVRALRENNPRRIDALIEGLAELTETAEQALTAGSLHELGLILSRAHKLLNELGVSSHELNKLCAVALNAGALGAKMTGGGLGGCVIALARGRADAAHIAALLEQSGATETWVSTLPRTNTA